MGMAGFMRNHFGTVEGFQVYIEEEPDGAFAATSPALPGYVAYGQSESGAIRRLKRAIRRNLSDVAEDYHTAGDVDGRESRHKSRLYLEPPLTSSSKIVLAGAAVVLLGLLIYEIRRRD